MCYRTLEVRLENNLAASAWPTHGPGTGGIYADGAAGADAHVRAAALCQRRLARCVGSRRRRSWANWRSPGRRSAAHPQAYRLTWSLPALRLTDVRPSPVQVGLPSVQHVLQAEVPDAPAAGMAATTFGGPVGVEVVCGVANHPLLS